MNSETAVARIVKCVTSTHLPLSVGELSRDVGSVAAVLGALNSSPFLVASWPLGQPCSSYSPVEQRTVCFPCLLSHFPFLDEPFVAKVAFLAEQTSSSVLSRQLVHLSKPRVRPLRISMKSAPWPDIDRLHVFLRQVFDRMLIPMPMDLLGGLLDWDRTFSHQWGPLENVLSRFVADASKGANDESPNSSLQISCLSSSRNVVFSMSETAFKMHVRRHIESSQGISVEKLAIECGWAHEYGIECAGELMLCFLRQFPKLCSVTCRESGVHEVTLVRQQNV